MHIQYVPATEIWHKECNTAFARRPAVDEEMMRSGCWRMSVLWHWWLGDRMDIWLTKTYTTSQRLSSWISGGIKVKWNWLIQVHVETNSIKTEVDRYISCRPTFRFEHTMQYAPILSCSVTDTQATASSNSMQQCISWVLYSNDHVSETEKLRVRLGYFAYGPEHQLAFCGIHGLGLVLSFCTNWLFLVPSLIFCYSTLSWLPSAF